MLEKILIIEDDNEINEMLQHLLDQEYSLTAAYSGTEGLLWLNSEAFNLVLLDIMLPGKDGYEVLEEIRKNSVVPVIVLTAISDKSITVEFLTRGANDYIVKPFNVDELKARIQVQLRAKSSGAALSAKSVYKNIVLNGDLFEIHCNNKRIDISKKEFLILQLLIQHPKKIFSKDMLYEKVWGEAYYGDENTINVHLSNLRKKLHEVDPENAYIDTVWGIGVKLASEEGDTK